MAFLAANELFLDLPANSTDAFVEFVERIERLNKYPNFSKYDYVYLMRNFQETFSINVEDEYFRKKGASEITDYDFDVYRSMMISERTKFQLRVAREKALGAIDGVALLSETKIEIRKKANRIKELLDKLKLDSEKKESLMNKINLFLSELDRDRTRIVSFSAAMIQVSSAVGESAKKLKPVVELLNDVWKLLGRGNQDTKALPKWDDQKRLPAPPKQIEDMRSQKTDQIVEEDEKDD